MQTVAQCTGSDFVYFRLDCRLCTIVDDGIEEIPTRIMRANIYFHFKTINQCLQTILIALRDVATEIALP